MAPAQDVFNPRKFWTALLSSYMTPYFIITGDGPRLCKLPGDAAYGKQKKMICGCPDCLARKGLVAMDWEDPDTGAMHQIVVPYRLVARL